MTPLIPLSNGAWVTAELVTFISPEEKWNSIGDSPGYCVSIVHDGCHLQIPFESLESAKTYAEELVTVVNAVRLVYHGIVMERA